MKRIFAALLAGLIALPSLAETFEAAAMEASVSFDGTSRAASLVTAPGAVSAALAPVSRASLAASSLNAAIAPIEPDIVGPGNIPGFRDGSGIGPVSREPEPGYGESLLGGLFGMLLAPVAFAFEAAQAALFTPARMISDLAQGDWTGLLEPLRTAKNLVQDAALFAAGEIGLAAAPVWNALVPGNRVDFEFSNDRLIFHGGPLPEILKDVTNINYAVSPSWHTVFLPRDYRPYEHEFVHNRQWRRSLLFERVGENYRNFEGWDTNDAHRWLNLE